MQLSSYFCRIPGPEVVDQIKHKERRWFMNGIRKWLWVLVAMGGVAGLAAGCAGMKSSKETRVTIADLSAPARTTVEKMTAGGTVDKIDKEVERGRVVYDVE